MVWGLPRDSALAQATNTAWTVEHELLATGIEVAYEAYRAALAIGGVKRGRIPRPLRIPRPRPPRPRRPPQAPSTRPRLTTVDEVVKMLDASHKRIGN